MVDGCGGVGPPYPHTPILPYFPALLRLHLQLRENARLLRRLSGPPTEVGPAAGENADSHPRQPVFRNREPVAGEVRAACGDAPPLADGHQAVQVAVADRLSLAIE